MQLRDGINDILKSSYEKNTKYYQKNTYFILGEKKQALFDFIQENPGTTKENIVQEFKQESNIRRTYSRGPVFEGLKELKSHGLIIDILDKKNSQIHHVFVNPNNELSELIMNLNHLKERYFKILTKSRTILNKLNSDEYKKIFSKEIDSFSFNLSNTFFNFLFVPYKWLIMYFIISDLYFRHNKLYDEQTITERYNIINTCLRDIKYKISELYSFDKEPEGYKFLLQCLVSEFPDFNEDIVRFLKIFKQFDLTFEAESLMDIIWKIVYPIIDIFDFEYDQNISFIQIKDWRDLINTFYKNQYKSMS
ncbi:MAG: hypothetical protein ACPKPY_13250 [Nitrososphaeraceae archaeon]